MKVFTHPDFHDVYTRDPAAAPGRIQSIVEAIEDMASFEECAPAGLDDIERVHTERHIQYVEREGLYRIAALAAGGAIEAARTGLSEPAFAIIRPPGHHVSPYSS